MWMLLERVRFTLDGIECNKIGVSYEAFSRQPNFCSSPFWSCLHNQLWNFREVGTSTRFLFDSFPYLAILLYIYVYFSFTAMCFRYVEYFFSGLLFLYPVWEPL